MIKQIQNKIEHDFAIMFPDSKVSNAGENEIDEEKIKDEAELEVND